MSQNPYDYSTRKGVRPISWNDMHGLCKALALGVAKYGPEIILPIGRGGFYAGTLLAHMLRVEILPVYLTRRAKDMPVRQSPEWQLEPTEIVRGKRVLVVDEICGSGETLRMVMEKAAEKGTSEIRSAVLYAHSWGTETPDYIGLISDEFLLNPWDREILGSDGFEIHSEVVQALALQGVQPSPDLLIDAPHFNLAKGRQ